MEYSDEYKSMIAMQLNALDKGYVSLWQISAHYDPKQRSFYYVIAHSKREAISRFKTRIGWLTVYACEKVEDLELARFIISHPDKSIVF